MNITTTLFDAGELIKEPRRRSAPVKVKVTDDKITGVSGVALWGPMLDRLNVVGAADRRRLRPVGPGGYTGGECYRALVEVLLAGGDHLSDRALLDGPPSKSAVITRCRHTRRCSGSWARQISDVPRKPQR